jgi:hypothetical protein
MRVLIAIFLITFFNPAWASGTVREAQSLSLGEVAVVRNDAIYTLAIDPGLGMINDPAIVILKEGRPGIFMFENFPANTLINVTLNESSENTNFVGPSGGEQFELRPTLSTESVTIQTEKNKKVLDRVFGLKTQN